MAQILSGIIGSLSVLFFWYRFLNKPENNQEPRSNVDVDKKVKWKFVCEKDGVYHISRTVVDDNIILKWGKEEFQKNFAEITRNQEHFDTEMALEAVKLDLKNMRGVPRSHMTMDFTKDCFNMGCHAVLYYDEWCNNYCPFNDNEQKELGEYAAKLYGLEKIRKVTRDSVYLRLPYK